MIKSKEDLIDTYVLRADEEVFELFMQKCIEYGIKWTSGREPRNVTEGEAVACDNYFDLSFNRMNVYETYGLTRLTLDDFKESKDEEYVTISKEKLLKGYIDNRNKEIQKEWYKACNYYGFNMKNCLGKYDKNIFSYINDETVHFTNSDFKTLSRTELTISDFKLNTKTRTEFKVVSIPDYEALKAFHAGVEFYYKVPYYTLVKDVQTLIREYLNNSLYTKEEIKIDWRDIVNKYDDDKNAFNVIGCEMYFIYEGTEKDFIRMCHEVTELIDIPK